MNKTTDFAIENGELKSYLGRKANAVIPDGVVSIGKGAFSRRDWLKSVIIPSTVTSIGDSAFNGCSKLQSINIPDTVTSIGKSAFSGCSSLTEIILPSHLKTIEEEVFSYCTGLESISIPEGVISIGRGAFRNCKQLTHITIPQSVKEVDTSALSYCYGLKDADGFVIYRGILFCYHGQSETIIIPKNVRTIAECAFFQCENVKSVTIPDGVESIGDFAFSECGITSIIVPKSVTSIGSFAFDRCKSLTEIEIPESVTSIGRTAFGDCTSLTSVSLPESVTSINGSMFNGCSSLSDFTIHQRITSIGVNAFYGCNSLTSILIPKNVTSIDCAAFGNCVNLRDVTIQNTAANIASSAFDGTAFALNKENLENGVLYYKDLLIKEVSVHGTGVIKPGTRYICAGAFSNCYTNLTGLVVPEGIISIGSGAFSNCEGVRTITLGQWTDYYEKMIVDNCNSKAVIHTQSVPSEIPAERQAYALIGFVQDKETDFSNERAKAYLEYAAQNALNLKPLAFEYSELIQFLCNHKLISVKDVDSFIAEAEKRKDTEKKELLLSYEKTLDMDELTALREKKQSVKDQYEDEFKKRSAQRDSSQGISGLTFVAAGRLKKWKSYADIRKYLEAYGAKLDSTISNKADYLVTNDADIESEKNKKAQELGVRILSEEAFNDMVKYRYLDAERIVVPGWVKEIPENAFENCKNVQTVEICEGTEIIRANAFNECTHLISVQIPDTVGQIERHAFRKCYALQNVNLPKRLTRIGAGAFRFCHNLISITIPDSVHELVFGAFEYCIGLETVTIPTSVKEIWNNVFRGCEKLTIHAPAGSYAEQFAKENGIPIVLE